MAANDNSYTESLFPTKASFFIFWSYISLFVSQGLLVTAVHKRQIYGFNAVLVVLLTELVKMCICVSVYVFRPLSGGIVALLYDFKANRKLLLLYLVPAFLYCLYNNLTFINLKLFDVSTYYCLIQFRIVLTAIIYQILFRRQLNLIQWLSLIILTAGCLFKEYGLYNDISQEHHETTDPNVTNHTLTYQQVNGTRLDYLKHNASINKAEGGQGMSGLVKFFWSTSLLLFQMFCSCFAGVYNEFLLKDSSTAKNADIILQNIFMYLDSIICNLVVFLFSSTTIKNPAGILSTVADGDGIQQDPDLVSMLFSLLTSPLVIILILNNAIAGLVASFFLKSLNSILKTFASALELFAVTLLAWILFDNRVDLHTIVALLLVTVAMFVYSKNPVSVAPPGIESQSRPRNRDGFMLLPTSDD